jgi:hypothetical protein
MSMQREPNPEASREKSLEGSEEYFRAKVPEERLHPPRYGEDVSLPPPQDMGEDG